LSATPNGKDHDPDDRHQGSVIRTTRCGKLSSQKTLRHCTAKPSASRPSGFARGNAASVTQLASLRCHISNRPRHPAQGMVPRANSGLLAACPENSDQKNTRTAAARLVPRHSTNGIAASSSDY
jgi:hypothetical protein